MNCKCKDGFTPSDWSDAPEGVPRADEAESVTVRLPKRLVSLLRAAAKKEGVSLDVTVFRWLDGFARTHYYSPKARAAEKQRAREEDARALASGEKSQDDLRRENGKFAFPNVGIGYGDAKNIRVRPRKK